MEIFMFDIIGVITLVVLIAVFGFLITRAWKLKNAFLKWAGVFIAGLLTLSGTNFVAKFEFRLSARSMLPTSRLLAILKTGLMGKSFAPSGKGYTKIAARC
jgi:hypothetical protein